MRRFFFAGFFMVVAILLSPCYLAEAGQAEVVGSPYKIGFKIIKVPMQAAEPLVVAVWYPTDKEPVPMKYFLVKRELEADVAKDAPALKGHFPLVIMSHGGGVSASCMAVYAEELAAAGFVVAGPDHSDEFVACRSDRKLDVSIREWLRWGHGVSANARGGWKKGTPVTKFRHRPAEVKATIDALLELSDNPESPFYGVIDSDKIGMMGVSFGAWTTLAVSGAIPWFTDERIKAAVPIAGHPGASRGTDISRLKIPVMLIFGEDETMVLLDYQTPKKTEGMRQDYERANPPKFLIGVKAAKHLNFGGAGAFNAKIGRTFSTRQVRLNDEVTGVVNKYCIAFFRRYFLDDYRAEEILSKSDSRLFLFQADLGGR